MPRVSNSHLKFALALLGWLAVFLLLWLPLHQASRLGVDSHLFWPSLIGAAATVVATWSVARLFSWRFVHALLAVSLLLALVLRALHLGLVQFSGAGFTLEFFLHLEWQSVRLALAQYPWLALGLLLGVATLATLLLKLLRLQESGANGRRHVAACALGVAVIAGAACRASFPEYQLLRAWQSWNAPQLQSLSPEALARWTAVEWIHTSAMPKRLLQAYAPSRPRNLILVYLESVGAPLLEQQRWPQLMPHLQALQSEHALLPSIHASAFITIEGIVNSQCGSLLPFQRDSDTYASGERVFEHMICLGDVLRQAGYQQSYLGGAGMGFAGKGAFLSAHGYDQLMGYEHWQEQGMQAREGTWGLSDVELLQQADLEIDRLRGEGGPFHVSVLTIGTHLPGFRYAECAPYVHADGVDSGDFLHALSCTDQLIGDWVERLRERGVLDDSLLVITADHHVFPNPEMRALFGDAVDDRRLPLIALGASSARPEPDVQGASFDLAPTLLDLLGIEHNARFLAGRSLLGDEARRPYLANRYYGVLDGNPAPADRECDEQGPSTRLPLDSCSHGELLQVLAVASRTLDAAPPKLSCDAPDVTGVVTADNGDTELLFAGEPQLRRFTRDSRPLKSLQPGLYRLSLDPEGRVSEREFLHADIGVDELAQRRQRESAVQSAGLSLLYWQPPDDSATAADSALVAVLPDRLPDFSHERRGAWWLRHGEGVEAYALQDAPGQSFALALDQSSCLALLETPTGAPAAAL